MGDSGSVARFLLRCNICSTTPPEEKNKATQKFAEADQPVLK